MLNQRFIRDSPSLQDRTRGGIEKDTDENNRLKFRTNIIVYVYTFFYLLNTCVLRKKGG